MWKDAELSSGCTRIRVAIAPRRGRSSTLSRIMHRNVSYRCGPTTPGSHTKYTTRTEPIHPKLYMLTFPFSTIIRNWRVLRVFDELDRHASTTPTRVGHYVRAAWSYIRTNVFYHRHAQHMHYQLAEAARAAKKGSIERFADRKSAVAPSQQVAHAALQRHRSTSSMGRPAARINRPPAPHLAPYWPSSSPSARRAHVVSRICRTARRRRRSGT